MCVLPTLSAHKPLNYVLDDFPALSPRADLSLGRKCFKSVNVKGTDGQNSLFGGKLPLLIVKMLQYMSLPEIFL